MITAGFPKNNEIFSAISNKNMIKIMPAENRKN